ncbi:MAG: dockerin type I repeat-containing protein, partial [Ruminococcus sp.]|nr:dockerin type I repeat-containing protein [Ruminococcus sp.]
MKKALPPISMALAVSLLVGSALPLTASAAEDTISMKDTTAYIYNMDTTETLPCLYKSSMPDMAFISTVDYLKHIYVDEPTEEKNADGTYTITNPRGTMVIDYQNDTLHFDSFEDFSSAKENVDGTEMDVPYLKEYAPVIEGEHNGLDLDLSPYKIDIIEYDGKTYFPVSSIGLLFGATYNTAVYCEGAVYFIHCADIVMDNCYFANKAAYNTLRRSKDLVELTYNDLCFAFDKLYGRPAQAEIASVVEERGFDEALDVYNDDTRRAKELLLSDNMVDYVLGTAYLGQAFADGGHTAVNYPAILSALTPGTAVNGELNRLLNTEDFRDRQAMIYLINSLTASQRATNMAAFRSSQYKEDDLVQAWDDKSKAKLYVTGDTAVFAFDSFVNEAVYHFKWSLDYAKEKGVKRFVTDLSCNSGGNAAVVMYIMAMITNQNEDSYTASYRKMQTLTGNLTRVDNDLDLNLDGVINDLDKSVYYDFEYAFITSNISYSCGNLLPCLAKDAGFPILGERSGGGACSLLIAYTPETFFYTMSSYNKFITKDNKDVDSGAALDYDLTKQASDGSSTDYTGLYDAAAYSTLIDEFYAKGSYLYGDVNYNGEIDIDDASLIQRAGIDLAKLTDTQKALADVNGDGRVSILDVTCVQKYLAEYTSGT